MEAATWQVASQTPGFASTSSASSRPLRPVWLYCAWVDMQVKTWYKHRDLEVHGLKAHK